MELPCGQGEFQCTQGECQCLWAAEQHGEDEIRVENEQEVAERQGKVQGGQEDIEFLHERNLARPNTTHMSLDSNSHVPRVHFMCRTRNDRMVAGKSS